MRAILILAILGLVLTGCDKPVNEPPADASKPPSLSEDRVAVVGDRIITREQFQDAIQRQGGFQSKKDILDELITFQAALQKARAAGAEQDSALQDKMERLIVSHFREQELAKRLQGLPEVTDEQVAGYYQQNQDQFQTPQRHRAGVILLKVHPKAVPEKRQEIMARAETLQAQAAAADDTAFGQLVQKHSEDQATRYNGGNTGWLTPASPTGRWPQTVARTILQLEQPGQTAPVVVTEKGCYIVRLYEHVPAQQKPLPEVAQGIQYQLQRQQEQEVRNTFDQDLRNGLPVQVNQPLLEALTQPDRQMATRPPNLPGSGTRQPDPLP